MAIEIRAARFPEDESGISAIDASFTTEAVLKTHIDPRNIRLVETPIRPRVKHFTVYDLGEDWREWDEAHVASDDGRIIGFVASGYQFWNRRVVLWHLYVDPSYRRRGIGDRLLAKVFERAAREKALAVFLETSSLNVPGIAWYEKRGFSLGGIDSTLYSGVEGALEQAIFLVKHLSSEVISPSRRR